MLACIVGRTVFLAAAAADAGIKIQKILPTKFFDLLHAERCGFFDIFNHAAG